MKNIFGLSKVMHLLVIVFTLLLLSGCSVMPNLDVLSPHEEVVTPFPTPTLTPTPTETPITKPDLSGIFRAQKSANYQGYDVLGLARQDYKMICDKVLPGTVLGFLDGSFGDVEPALRHCLSTQKFAAFRGHCRDGTCKRNGTCPPGTPALDDKDRLRACGEKYNKIAQDTGVPCWLSPVLEHDEKDKKKVQEWFTVLKSAAPLCGMVQNPHTGTTIPGITLEKHGGAKLSKSNPDIGSTDGVSIYDVDTRSWWNNSKGFSLSWINRDNLRVTGEKGTPPYPHKRPLSRRVKPLDMDTRNRLMQPVTPETPWPAVCKVRRDIKSPEILKSAAEDYDNGDVRANKMVFLTKFSGSQFDIINSSGRKVACLKRYNPSLDGLNRYYLGSCSSLNNLNVMDKAGSEWIYFRNGNTCYRGNAIRRLGVYRDS